jgi:hypothetical protein
MRLGSQGIRHMSSSMGLIYTTLLTSTNEDAHGEEWERREIVVAERIPSTYLQVERGPLQNVA